MSLLLVPGYEPVVRCTQMQVFELRSWDFELRSWDYGRETILSGYEAQEHVTSSDVYPLGA